MIKRYELPNILLDYEPILRNVTGCNIHWKKGRSLAYRDVNKNQRSNIGKKAGKIRTVHKRESTDSLSDFFR